MSMTLAKNAWRRCCAAQKGALVSNASQKNSRANRQPAADRPLSEPEYGKQRRVSRKEFPAAGFYSSNLRHPDDEHHDCRQKPWMPKPKEKGCGKNAELYDQPEWASELIVGLSHTLRPEVRYSRRKPPHVHPGPHCFFSTGGNDSSHELQILEHHGAIVSMCGPQDGPANSKRSRPVSVEHAIQERPSSIPSRVPWTREEKVLWPNDVELVERRRYGKKGFRIVANIVVGNDDSLVRSETYTGKNPAYFSHLGHEVKIRYNVSDCRSPALVVLPKYIRCRPVDYDDFRMCREPVQISSKIRRGIRDNGLDWQNIGDRRNSICAHHEWKGQLVCRPGIRL